MFLNLKQLFSFFCLFACLLVGCNEKAAEHHSKINQQAKQESPDKKTVLTSKGSNEIVVGAAKTTEYFADLKGKTLGLVVNQTSKVGEQHLVDLLLENGMNIKTIFAPEHGFRGKADAGELLKDGKDAKTGLPLISLYGKNKKPMPDQLAGLDLVIFDIQDVGARFYTYISTMHYVMEACAENEVACLILDRPNPNGHYVDGPIRESEYQSFVGLDPIPIVHGMTIGELANMINEEGWLKHKTKCKLNVVKMDNYSHDKSYDLPVKPSPNLPNALAINLYPSLCFFEGTNMSIGRGTKKQFQILGHPDFPIGDFKFTPKSMEGAKYPKHENKECKGFDFSIEELAVLRQKKQINLSYLIDAYQAFPDKAAFFLENNFIDKLAGTASLQKQIISNASIQDIRASWEPGLERFKMLRQKYLLYD